MRCVDLILAAHFAPVAGSRVSLALADAGGRLYTKRTTDAPPRKRPPLRLHEADSIQFLFCLYCFYGSFPTPRPCHVAPPDPARTRPPRLPSFAPLRLGRCGQSTGVTHRRSPKSPASSSYLLLLPVTTSLPLLHLPACHPVHAPPVPPTRAPCPPPRLGRCGRLHKMHRRPPSPASRLHE